MQKQRYVQGGTEFWEGTDLMPRKRKLNHEQELELFEMVRKGFSNKDIAKKFGIAQDTVGAYYRRTLRERGKEQDRGASRERLVALREIGNRLTFSVDDGYVGKTTVGGVEETCTFKASDDMDAIGKFDKWCADMRAEQEFMDMVERKGEPQPQDDEPVDVTPAPVPEIVVRPWKEIAEERKQRIEELERELEEAKTQRVEFAEGYQMELHNPAYLIWAKHPEAKCYGLFLTMEDALTEMDRLNEVAKFLGSGGAFEVEEVEWKVGQ